MDGYKSISGRVRDGGGFGKWAPAVWVARLNTRQRDEPSPETSLAEATRRLSEKPCSAALHDQAGVCLLALQCLSNPPPKVSDRLRSVPMYVYTVLCKPAGGWQEPSRVDLPSNGIFQVWESSTAAHPSKFIYCRLPLYHNHQRAGFITQPPAAAL